MRNAAIISGVFHVLVIGVMYFGLPLFQTPDEIDSPPIIEIEFARVADVTNPPKPEPEPEKQPEPKEEPPEPTVNAKNEPEPPPPLPEPEPEPAPAEAAPPEPKEEKEEKVAALPPDPKKSEEEPEPEKAKAQPPPPKVRPKTVKKKPQTPEKKEKKFDANRLAAMLDKKLQESEAQRPETKKTDDRKAPSKPATQPAQQRRIAAPVSISEKDRIRAHIMRNWNPNLGAPGADKMEVRVRIFLKSDGSLSRPPEIIDEFRAGQSDQVFRPFAESAVRAVLKSDPLPVPLDKYEAWREIEFTFSLKDMLG